MILNTVITIKYEQYYIKHKILNTSNIPVHLTSVFQQNYPKTVVFYSKVCLTYQILLILQHLCIIKLTFKMYLNILT